MSSQTTPTTIDKKTNINYELQNLDDILPNLNNDNIINILTLFKYTEEFNEVYKNLKIDITNLVKILVKNNEKINVMIDTDEKIKNNFNTIMNLMHDICVDFLNVLLNSDIVSYLYIFNNNNKDIDIIDNLYTLMNEIYTTYNANKNEVNNEKKNLINKIPPILVNLNDYLNRQLNTQPHTPKKTIRRMLSRKQSKPKNTDFGPIFIYEE